MRTAAAPAILWTPPPGGVVRHAPSVLLAPRPLPPPGPVRRAAVGVPSAGLDGRGGPRDGAPAPGSYDRGPRAVPALAAPARRL